MKSPHEFYCEVNGNCYNLDNAYGVQCWDGKAYFNQEAGYTIPYCIYSGGVKDIYNLFINNLYDQQKNFVSVGINELQDGDWLVYGESQGGGYGHVCMFRCYSGNNCAIVLGQNQGGYNGCFNQINLSLDGVIICLRPRCYISSEEQKATPSTYECDQVLTRNSKVVFNPFTVEAVDTVKDWIYSSEIGGWVAAGPLRETDANDGCQDDILNVGSHVTYDGQFTVSQVNVSQNTVYLEEMGLWINAGCLTEVAEGD